MTNKSTSRLCYLLDCCIDSLTEAKEILTQSQKQVPVYVPKESGDGRRMIARRNRKRDER